MIPVKTVHRRLDDLLNRLGSSHSSTYTVTQKDRFINRAIKIWQENVTALAETTPRFREVLRDLLNSYSELKEVNTNDEFTTFAYPKDFYRRLRQKCKAVYKDCPERNITLTIIQRDDLNKIEQDCFWNASFLWGDSFAVESKGGIEVYHQQKFDITKMIIDYYEELPPIYSPSLIESNKAYIHPITSQTLTEDHDFKLDNDYQLRPILDIATLLIRVARGDSVEFQLELSNILNIEKLHLN